MARPDLGTKRLCPNCGAKYYDLNRDPILCPKCNASFTTGIVAAREPDDEDELDSDDEGIELVALEEADESDAATAAGIEDDSDTDVPVDTDDDALIDDDPDEVSEVVRGADEADDEEER